MLDILPALTNINHSKKIPSKAIINVGNFHHVNVEYNIGKTDI